MSRKNRHTRYSGNARVELAMHLADYWFHREYPGWYALDPETMQPYMSEDEAVEAIKKRFLRISALDDVRLEQLREATIGDIMRQSPLRNMSPKKIAL